MSGDKARKGLRRVATWRGYSYRLARWAALVALTSHAIPASHLARHRRFDAAPLNLFDQPDSTNSCRNSAFLLFSVISPGTAGALLVLTSPDSSRKSPLLLLVPFLPQVNNARHESSGAAVLDDGHSGHRWEIRAVPLIRNHVQTAPLCEVTPYQCRSREFISWRFVC